MKVLENQSSPGNSARSSGWGKEWDGEKEEENKTKSLEEENKFSEEKLWQPWRVGPWPSDEEGGLFLFHEAQKVAWLKILKVLLWTGYGPLQEGDQLWGRVFKALLQPPSTCPESRLVESTSFCPEPRSVRRDFFHTEFQRHQKVKIDCLTKVWSKSENDFYGAKEKLSPGAPSPQLDRWQTKKPRMRSSSTCQTFIGTGVSLLSLFFVSSLANTLKITFLVQTNLYSFSRYKTPLVRHPHQNWVFMSYETATNVRER